jgi:hypothetical protein
MENLKEKVNSMLWDYPLDKRVQIIEQIFNNSKVAFENKELALRAINSLTWYELLEILSIQEIYELLDDRILNRLFPKSRKNFYLDA